MIRETLFFLIRILIKRIVLKQIFQIQNFRIVGLLVRSLNFVLFIMRYLIIAILEVLYLKNVILQIQILEIV